jgi:pimeloyl-ACP methyl ester carboxylesterase
VEEPARLSDELVVHVLEPFCASRRQADNLFRYLAQNDGRHTIALEHELQRLTAPTTLIWGTGDHYFALEWAFWLLSRRVLRDEHGQMWPRIVGRTHAGDRPRVRCEERGQM